MSSVSTGTMGSKDYAGVGAQTFGWEEGNLGGVPGAFKVSIATTEFLRCNSRSRLQRLVTTKRIITP